MGIKQDFRVYCSTNFNELNKSLITDTFQNDGELILEGIASTTSIDEDGDYMTKSCLEDMKRQAIGLSVLKEHGRKLDDILGKVISIPESDSDKFKIKFKILPKWEYYLLEFLDNDINLGLSIGAKAVDYEPIENSDYGWKVNKAKLYEISLIPLPANWDSFGSVKISKEQTDDDVFVAKCFNGACKQIVQEYSNNMNKEVEDAQRKDEEKFLTKKEALNMINEEAIAIYDRVLSEVLDETKKMIEKYRLDTNNNKDSNESKNSNESENSNDNNVKNNSSKNDKEDEEKEKSMKEEKIDKVETKETPDVQKNLEEVEGTSEGKETKMEKENKIDGTDETIDVYVSADEVSNQDVLKGIEDLKSLMTKGIDEGIETKVDEKLEEFKKSLPNVDELKKEIRKEVEEELFKDLTTERQPTSTEQPKVEEVEEDEEVEEETNKAMNSYDIAKMLCS